MRKEGRQRGFTLIEILIVLAVLGIMAAMVVPNLTGFLGRGKDRSYEADQRALQSAVNAYYTDTLGRPGTAKYPTANGTAGSPGNNTYLNMTQLVSSNYIRDVPRSASADNPGYSNSSPGSYSWYVDANGVVQSAPTYVSGLYP